MQLPEATHVEHSEKASALKQAWTESIIKEANASERKKMLQKLKKKVIRLLAGVTMFASLDIPTPTVYAEENSGDGSDYSAEPADASSVTIDSLETEVFSGASQIDSGEDDVNAYKWTASSSSSEHKFAYRVSYSTSGEGTIGVGEASFYLPLHLFYDRDGNVADSYEMSLPSESEIQESYASNSDNFLTYTEEDTDGDGTADFIKVYNAVETDAALNGYFELIYRTSKSSFEYVDESSSADFTAELHIGDTVQTSNACRVTIDTNASVSSSSLFTPIKTAAKKMTTWSSDWGTNVKPENADDYYYQVWNLTLGIPSSITQKYDLTLDPDFSSESGEVKVLGYKTASSGWTTSNTITGLTNSQTVYGDVLLAFPKSSFADLDQYTIKGSIKTTLHPADGKDEDTVTTASNSCTYKKPQFNKPTGYVMSVANHGSNWDCGRHVTGAQYANYQLKEFQDGTVDTLSNITFLSHSENNYLAATLADGADATDPSNYMQTKVATYLESGALYLEDVTEKDWNRAEYKPQTTALTTDDYNIKKIRFSLSTTTYKFNEDEQSFEASSISSEEWLTIQVTLADGTEKAIAKFQPSTETYSDVDTSIVSNINKKDRTITFANSANVKKWKLSTSNSYGATNYTVYTTVDLLRTKTVENATKDKDIAYLVGDVTGMVHINGEDETSTTYGFARIVPVQKNSYITKKVVGTNNSKKNKTYTISWATNAYETITKDSGATEDIRQESGVFYDLLPSGNTFNKKSLSVYSSSGALSSSEYSVETTKNYKNSGRTLVKITINTATNSSYRIFYDTTMTWDAMKDYGTSATNTIAYETGNDSISNGYYDDPTKPVSKKQADALSGTEAKLFKNLDSENEDTTGKFIYTSMTYNITAITSSASGLYGKVAINGNYSKSATVSINDNYVYKIRYQNTYSSQSKNMVIYDSLENYKNSDWHGTLQSIDLTQLTSKGIAPVVYVSTVENLNIASNSDLTNTDVWTVVDENTDLSTAKAVAIDISKKEDGSTYVLDVGQSVIAYLYMQAPDTAPEKDNGYPTAYNNVYMANTLIGVNSESSYLIHQDYTEAQLIVSGNVTLKKISSTTNEGLQGLQFRLSGTSDYGTSIDEIATSNSSGIISFENVEKGTYTLNEYDSTDDYLMDYTTHTVTIDGSGHAIIDGVDYTDTEFTVTNDPRVHTDINFTNMSYVNNKIITGTKYRLSGTSSYGTEVMETATSENGKVVFKNIEKGTYTLKEISSADNYIKSGVEYTLVIDDNGNVSITANDDASAEMLVTKNNSFTIYSEPYHQINLIKKNNYDYGVVEGVTFKLSGTSDYGTAVDTSLTTDDSGMLSFSKLESGTYILQETAVTDKEDAINVVLDETQRLVTVDKKGTVTCDTLEQDNMGYLIVVDAVKSDQKVVITKKYEDETPTDHTNDLPTINIANNNPNASGQSDNSNYAVSPTSLEDDSETIVDKAVNSIKSFASNLLGSLFTNVNAEESTSAWLSDWAYDIQTNNSTKYIRLKQYNGSETTYEIPATGTVNGVEYPVTVTKIDTSLTSNTVWGTITELSFAENFNSKHLITSMYALFASSKLTKLDLSNFDTTGVTNMQYLFYGANYLQELNVTNLNISKATNLQNLFTNTSKLTKIVGIEDWDTSNVEIMSSMFSDSGIVSLDLHKWNVSKVTTMSSIFSGCSSLTSLDLSGWNTSAVTSMSSMFQNCRSLTELDVSNFDTSSVTSMKKMFYYCQSLTSLDANDWKTNKVIDMSLMFSHCTSLKELNVSNFDTSSVTSMDSTFHSCSSLTSLDVSNWNTSKVTTMSHMFYGCSSLTELDVSNFDTSKVTTICNMFGCDAKIVSLNLSNWNTSRLTNMYITFQHMNCLQSLNLSGWDISNVTSSVNCFDSTPVKAITLWKPVGKEIEATALSNVFSLTVGNAKKSNSLEKIKIQKGDISALTTPYAANTIGVDGYTGNWTAFTETNHKNGSKLATKSVTINGISYTSLQDVYNSITDEQWEANPDGIWFVRESTAQDASEQSYTSVNTNIFTPEYDSDGNLLKTAEETYSKDGYWQKMDDSTYVYTFYVIKSDQTWYAWEDAQDGYTSSNTLDNPLQLDSSKSGTITNTSNVVAEQKYGSLSITKAIQGQSTDKSYGFTITLTKADGSALSGTKLFGNTAFKDGVAKVSLKANETVTITDIPEGYHYVVTEIGYNPHYENNENNIVADTTQAVVVTNINAEVLSKTPSGFTLTNSVDGENKDLLTDTEFNYTVIFTNLTNDTVYSMTKSDNSTVEFTSDENGDATVEFTLKANESISLMTLLENAKYTIVQNKAVYTTKSGKEIEIPISYTASANNNTMTTTSKESDSSSDTLSTAVKTVSEGEESKYTFKNTLNLTKDLVLTAKDDSTDNQEFEFTITLKGLDANATVATDSYGKFTADDDGTAEKTITLKNNEKIEIKDLPIGVTYTVTQTKNDVYASSVTVNAAEATLKQDKDKNNYVSGKIAIDDVDTDEIVWTNTKSETYSIFVKNEVSGNMGNKTKYFDYTIQFDTSRAGTTMTAKSVNGDTTTIKLIQIDSKGVAKFKLKNGENLLFEGLTEKEVLSMSQSSATVDSTDTEKQQAVESSSMSISETDYSKEGYTTTYITSYNDGDVTVTFTNKKEGTLPTGISKNTALGIIGIVGIALFGLYFFLFRKH